MVRRLLIGIGNPYRRDDGVGIVVVRRARALLPADTEVLECRGDLLGLLEVWQGSHCVVVDAMCSGGTPGEILRVEVHRQPLPVRCRFYSTHSFGFQDLVALARALNQLPPALIVYGIEGADFGEGEGLSLEVEKAVTNVVRYIASDLLESETKCTSSP